VQIADRWHLMENASAAFLEAVRPSIRPIRVALDNTTIDQALLTHAQRLQHEGYLRREEAYGIIRTLATAGTAIKEIVRELRRGRMGTGQDAARRRSLSRCSPKKRLPPASIGSRPERNGSQDIGRAPFRSGAVTAGSELSGAQA
jgi:hypothetical protein